jgi:hypothetical protein
MRLGIMQPYFFPYIGHFALIAHTEQWIVFDVTQYTRRSWISRNRVLHPEEGWTYVTIPLSNPSTSIRISEARIADKTSVARSVEGKLTHYRRHAPHYEAVRRIVASSFCDCSDSLVDLNVRGLQAVCAYLDVPFRFRICSQMTLGLPKELEKGLWAAEICVRLNADQYLNPIGGSELFDVTQFEKRGIKLQFLDIPEWRYDTASYSFEPNLSILDVMMWNGPQEIADFMYSQATRLEAID